jgi:RimJ/RimL family protein N-acetyltransferase
MFLTPVTKEMRRAFGRSRESFAAVTGLRLPDGWPVFPEAFSLAIDGSVAPWTGYLFCVEDQLVGNGGFVGPPDPSGTAEIGFEIAPEFRNHGFGTSAARTLIEIGLEHGAYRIIAHTLAERNASIAALRKAGMAFAAEIQEPSLGQIWRYTID